MKPNFFNIFIGERYINGHIFFLKILLVHVAQLKKKYGWESSTNTDLTQEMIFVKSLEIINYGSRNF